MPLRRVLAGCLLGATASIVLLSSPSTAPISRAATTDPVATSFFDTGAEGWTAAFLGDAPNAPSVSFYPRDGNPGGYIYSTDNQSGPPWYWQAPSKFLGNVSAIYDRSLQFDLKESIVGSDTNDPDIILVGGGLTLIYNTQYDPGLDWTTYIVPLNETKGWTDMATGRAPTRDQMLTVLSSLTTLQIRAEYAYGPDIDSLDNVVLGGKTLNSVFLPLIEH